MTGDPEPTPCHHSPPHEHGSRHAYITDKCRCRPCRDSNNTYQRRRHRMAAYGRTPGGWVDAEPVREHVRRLRAVGMGRRRLAEVAGLDGGLIHVLMNGRQGRPPSVRISPETARRLLAVPLPDIDDLADGAQVDGVGVRRRLQALVAIGWTGPDLAGRMGWSHNNLWRIVHGYGAGLVMVSTRRKVLALYDELSMDPAPLSVFAVRARRLAAKHGWPPPLAWDDDTIDDPAARPAHDIQGHDRGKPRDLDLEDRVLVLTRAGLSAAEIAVRLRCTTRYVQRVRSRYRSEGDAA